MITDEDKAFLILSGKYEKISYPINNQWDFAGFYYIHDERLINTMVEPFIRNLNGVIIVGLYIHKDGGIGMDIETGSGTFKSFITDNCWVLKSNREWKNRDYLLIDDFEENEDFYENLLSF